MAKDALAQFALNEARCVVAPDGDLVLEDVRENVAYIRYKIKKSQAECAECIMSTDDVKFFLQDIFCRKAPHIKEFSVTVEET